VIASDRYPFGTPLAEVATGKAEQHDSRADELALLELAAWCEEFSPTVGVEPPDNLCLDVTGLAQLFGSEQLLAQHVLKAFARRGLVVRLAIADTVGAAWALAHYGNAPCIAPNGDKAIRPLPVEALRLDGQAEILAECGIERIEQLMALPREALAERFDPRLLRRLNQAIGIIPEPIVSHRPPPEIEVAKRLEFPLSGRQALEHLLAELLTGVAQELARRQQGALQFHCELRCESATIAFTVGLFRPSANPSHLMELAAMQLERVRLPGPIDLVTLGVISVAPLSTWQQELFDPSRRENRRHVGLLVDRLSNRLGREAVIQALPQAEAQPELAVRYEPLAGARPSKSKQQFKPLRRPLRLEAAPLPIEVLAVAPYGPPSQFHYQCDYRIAKSWGPERIQTGWWRGRYVQRDYYRVETAEGKRFWIFRELRSGNWFLHGAFD
jgi:protein ImuB